jgi:hypothetical protein
VRGIPEEHENISRGLYGAGNRTGMRRSPLDSSRMEGILAGIGHLERSRPIVGATLVSSGPDGKVKFNSLS